MSRLFLFPIEKKLFISLFELTFFFVFVLGIGYASLTTNCFLALYYNVLIAYCFYYLIASFQLIVPWSTCNNWWNTKSCVDQETLLNRSRTDSFELVQSNTFMFLFNTF